MIKAICKQINKAIQITTRYNDIINLGKYNNEIL